MNDDDEISDEKIDLNNLIHIRKGMAYSQAVMAEKMGLSKSAYAAIETGEARFRKIHWLAAQQIIEEWERPIKYFLLFSPNGWTEALVQMQKLGECKIHRAGLVGLKTTLSRDKVMGRNFVDSGGYILMEVRDLTVASWGSGDMELSAVAELVTGGQ